MLKRMLLKLLLHMHYLGDFLIKERHPKPEVINYAPTDAFVPTKFLYIYLIRYFIGTTIYLTFTDS